jgi:hypothetical protein
MKKPVIYTDEPLEFGMVISDSFLPPPDKLVFKKRKRSSWVLWLLSILVLLVVTTFAFAAEKPSIPKEYWGRWVNDTNWGTEPSIGLKEALKFCSISTSGWHQITISSEDYIDAYERRLRVKKISLLKNNSLRVSVYENIKEGGKSITVDTIIIFKKTRQSIFNVVLV